MLFRGSAKICNLQIILKMNYYSSHKVLDFAILEPLPNSLDPATESKIPSEIGLGSDELTVRMDYLFCNYGWIFVSQIPHISAEPLNCFLFGLEVEQFYE